MKHTPGPWKVEARTTRGVFGHTTHVVSMDKSHIAEISPNAIEANAEHIAKAPKMLAQLKYLIEVLKLNGLTEEDDAIIETKKIIKEATYEKH